jgi:hypothetical protein
VAAQKAQALPTWMRGLPQQPGIYMVTLQFTNGARTAGPCTFHAGRMQAWSEEMARMLYLGWTPIAHYAIPPVYDGGSE